MMKQLRKMWTGMLFTILLSLCLSGCGEKQEKKEDLNSGMEDVQGQIEKEIEHNSKTEIGKYVTPEETAFTWETVEGGVALTGYGGAEKAIIIPDRLGGSAVVEIRPGAFSQAAVVGVRLPDTVVRIDEKAFYYCTSLVELQLGSATKEIGEQALEGCIVAKKVVLNDGLEEIGEMAFANCSSLAEISLPSTLKIMGKGTFVLSGIEKINIPGNINEVSEEIFANCTALTTVIIETGVTKIDSDAFDYCEAMTKIEIPETVAEIENNAFLGCGNLTIYAPAGSAAEGHAAENEIEFVAQ